jgi:hypothetical protein
MKPEQETGLRGDILLSKSISCFENNNEGKHIVIRGKCKGYQTFNVHCLRKNILKSDVYKISFLTVLIGIYTRWDISTTVGRHLKLKFGRI